jgi:hypothetical protein
MKTVYKNSINMNQNVAKEDVNLLRIGLQVNLISGVFKHRLRKNKGHCHSELQDGLIHASFHE